MFMKNKFPEFKLEFGSTVTVLTTAAACTNYKRPNNQGVFTGVVLDDTDLKFDRLPKTVNITVEGEYCDNDYYDDEYEEDKNICCKDNDSKYYEEEKNYKHEKEDEEKHQHKYEAKYDEEKYHHKHEEKNDDDKYYHKKECKHKHDKCQHKHKVKGKDEFLILSLTCPSYPFIPGQLVWINIEEIVALSVACPK
ncbi:hypothetical protein [Dendrosporobacter sp. 1207_IL3150]|uniref:hypothetical protein n=1 Tax=Dendrosporobacter sp. 1207_IL3150 TaxID=3084054 RepID=UPI002FD9C2BC